MNLFSDYQSKILEHLKKLKSKKIIKLPAELKSFNVGLPPKNQKADMSCNAALLIAKINDKSALDFAEILKKKFLEDFKEFEKIEIAKPGFLNIFFKINFWENYIKKIVKSDKKFGSTKNLKKKYNIEFVSANPTGPLHVGHCRGAILGDTLSNLLKFNGHSVTKEYYVNDYGNQIKNFVYSVYRRILEITDGKPFPNNDDFYPVIKSKKIKSYKNLDKIYEELCKISLKCSLLLIKNNLNMLGVSHDKFVYESKLIKNDLVSKTINKCWD